MKKLVEDHRKQLGNFEIIDWVDETAIADMRARTQVDAPLEVNWTWEYGSEAEELRNLYEKGKAGQWNAETDLDWDIPVSKDDWVIGPEVSLLAQLCKEMGHDEATQKAAAFDELNYSLSQLLHGEQGALQICGQLTNVCQLMDEKWYAGSQVIDEVRHVEALAKFLERKMGTIYPVTPTIKLLLDTLLAAPTSGMKTLGMQTLFEGVAMGIFNQIREAAINPLIKTMIGRVESDEARHAAFGVLCMRRVVKQATPEEMVQMEDWAFSILEALNASSQIDTAAYLGPKYGLDPEAVATMITSLPEFPEFNSLMYMHTVIPNLRNLGLITDRTADEYRRCGMLYDAHRARPQDSAVSELVN